MAVTRVSSSKCDFQGHSIKVISVSA